MTLTTNLRLDLQRDNLETILCIIHNKHLPSDNAPENALRSNELHLPWVTPALQLRGSRTIQTQRHLVLGCHEYVEHTQDTGSVFQLLISCSSPKDHLCEFWRKERTLNWHSLLSSMQMSQQTWLSSKQFCTCRRSCHSCTKWLSSPVKTLKSSLKE